jgi:GTPase SAR1 family protein
MGTTRVEAGPDLGGKESARNEEWTSVKKLVARLESVQKPQIKLLLIGDSGVGKSCCLLRFGEEKRAEEQLHNEGKLWRSLISRVQEVDRL